LSDGGSTELRNVVPRQRLFQCLPCPFQVVSGDYLSLFDLLLGAACLDHRDLEKAEFDDPIDMRVERGENDRQ